MLGPHDFLKEHYHASNPCKFQPIDRICTRSAKIRANYFHYIVIIIIAETNSVFQFTYLKIIRVSIFYVSERQSLTLFHHYIWQTLRSVMM